MANIRHRWLRTALGLATVAVGCLAFAPQVFAAASVESLKLTSPSTITIVYSQPVYTSPSDYANFTGSFSGESVSSVSGSGSNTVVLTLANPISSGGTGYVTIGTNVQDVGDLQYFGGATWNIVSDIGPAITSFGISSNESDGAFSGTNNTITVSFSTNEQVNVLNMTVAGHPVSVNGGGTGPFSATYTMQSGDAQNSIPVSVTLTDSNNNQTSVSFSYSGGTAAISTGGPVINSIASNANTPGVLSDGDSITFTLTPSFAEPNARVTGSYNGVPLSWATTNNGANYVATYVVAAGQSSQSAPLQISGVTLTDENGNTSAAASGYDIEKTISVGGTAAESTATTVSAASTASTADLATELQSLESQLAGLESQVTGGTATTNGTATAAASDPSAGYQFNNFLGVGSQGADVTALQERLTADGIYSGPITGFYGTLTQTAVENYQAAHGIDVKGYVGPATRTSLNSGV